MNNGWTWGQYRLLRIALGLYLFIHFAHLLPWGEELFSSRGMLPLGSLSPLFNLLPSPFWLSDSPITVFSLILIGALSALFFLFGKWDRPLAILIWYVLAALFTRNPLIANPSLPYIGWALLAHATLPKRKKGEFKWQFSPALFLAAWMVMALSYSYSGYMKLSSPSWIDGSAFEAVLSNPLARVNLLTRALQSLPKWLLQGLTWGALISELACAPLSLFKRTRPWIWLSLFSMQVGLLFLLRFPDLTFGMILFHLFTFDPAWIAPKKRALQVFYDGKCALCHGFVAFVLRENRQAQPLIFSPLQGRRFDNLTKLHPEALEWDSLVIYETQTGALLHKTEAVICILENLGGMWRLIALLLKALPLCLTNRGYETVARIRHTLWGKPNDACPTLPAEYRPYILLE